MLEKLRRYKRVIKISEKPSLKDYSNVVKVTGLGIVLIGGIGILLQFLFQLFGGF